MLKHVDWAWIMRYINATIYYYIYVVYNIVMICKFLSLRHSGSCVLLRWAGKHGRTHSSIVQRRICRDTVNQNHFLIVKAIESGFSNAINML